jgi:hypothetical protein
MRLAALLLALLMTSPALAADIFQSETAGYSIIYSDDWVPEAHTTADNIFLKCTLPICEGTIRASIVAAADYRYANDTPDKLFNRIHPERVIAMVKANAASLGTVKEIGYPKRHRLGNTEGFIGTFRITYKDARHRHMIYGLVLNKGYFYHIQFLSPEAPNAQLSLLANALFDGFQVNPSE